VLCFLLACPGGGGGRKAMLKNLFSGAGEGEVVAVAGGVELRSGHLLYLYNNLPARMREQMPLKDYVEMYVNQKLILLDALESGFDGNPDLLARLDLAFNDIFTATYVNYMRMAGLTEEQMRDYYEENRANFIRPERVRVRHIIATFGKEPSLFNSQKDDAEGRDQARRKIEGLQARLQKGESFEELARRYSEDRSALQGGDIGFIRREEAAAPFAQAAFALDRPGQTSGAVETSFGFHLIQLIERENSGQMSYEDAREQIRRILAPPLDPAAQQARMNERVEELKKRFGVEIYPDKFPELP
jgi:hypothetical protein